MEIITRAVVMQMPTAEGARAVSQAVAAQKQAEWEEKVAADKAKCRADYPRLINFINKKIEEATANGVSTVSFSFDDEGWKIHDDRCIITLHGQFYPEHAQELTEIYKALGFKGWIHHLYCVTDRCYRSGEVYLWW